MKSIEIIIVCVVTIIGALTQLKWKKNKTKKIMLLFFVIMTIIGAVIIAFNRFFIDDKAIDASKDYLAKNRARLNPFLYIDEINSDTVYYHLEIKNGNPIAAKNVTYLCEINKQFSQYEPGSYEGEIAKGEAINVYTPLWTAPAIINNVDFYVRLYLYYDSIWKVDTLHHQERYTFIIPVKVLSINKYNPTERRIYNVKTMEELLYDQMVQALSDSVGSLEFVVVEEDQKDSVSNIINTDSLKLIYNISRQEIVLHRIFADEQLVLRKNLKGYKRKGYHVILTWNHRYYNLYVNTDSADVRIKIKNPSPKGQPKFNNKNI